ncbi:hypothetical protein [Curtobacterium poinsettiae]|uniref:Uncharacterized protein n=1 Tax=Curtobacterium poinsettiae TaxID=159612 RepID=A0ABT3RYK5_9MICO|nr:hypothetical protein [Curtobacterium flaccumfaciens]MBT1611086.1 hypothetical protein [Curtobacterium flaccumfaciens pv. poinsettiae]MCX2847697.1 hypothetical protein [Curtobacterium flaccumfaciens pv. poinsettiae]UXN17214.1 hypothetical protein N8D78_10010 [Curtobacterium flaccumfaciens pv. poinsettiae]
MDDARPGTGVAGAGSTGTAVRRQYGPPPVPLIAWSGGRAVFAFGVPFAAGLLLAGVVLLLGVPGGRVALVNGAFAALDGTGVPAPLFAVGAVIAALGLGFGVTAATVVVLAAADDAVAGPRDAWRWSVHHWRLVVEAALVALVAVAVVTATAVWWRAGGWGTVVIVVLLASVPSSWRRCCSAGRWSWPVCPVDRPTVAPGDLVGSSSVVDTRRRRRHVVRSSGERHW